MKLLFDENLSPQLVQLLADLFPDSTHVHLCGLGSSGDDAIWEYARANSFTIVSKDSDFEERCVLFGAPPKLIWVRLHNSSSREVASLIRSAFRLVAQFINDKNETYMILGRQRKRA